MALLELVEPRPDGVDAARARIVERAAAERREAGAEHDAGIDEVGILDHPLAQAGRALVDQRRESAGRSGPAAAMPAVGARTTLPSRQV